MKTKLLSKNFNGLKFLLILSILMLGVGTAWAGDSYYTGFKATGGATGKGYVYASTNNTATPVYETEVTAESQSSDLGSSGATKQYYAWAKAVRGSKFNGWSISGDNGNVTPTSGTDSPITVTVTSAKNKTNTGTATATWTTYTKVNVTYNPSEDGVYSVTYQYNSYDATTQEITTGDAENLSRTISSENGAQTIGSYKNDVITLKSTSGTFQGWYSDAGFTSQLSTDNPYTYTAPTSGSAAVYPKYEHVDKYYGRLTASIAEVPYSMPGGGTIFVSKEEAGTGTYSDAAQTVDNTGMGTTSLKYYLHAKPNDKRYVFRGWYSNPECTGTALSTSADYTYTFTATSMNSASPTTGNVYAAFDFNLYYMQVEAEPAVPGLGMVLVKDNNTGTPEYTNHTTHSEQFLYAYRLAPTANAYLYAKPKYGYKFSGWYDNPDCTGTAKSTANPYTFAATGTSTDPMNPTITKLYAKFIEDATTVNITYNKPDQTKGEYTASVLDIAEVDDDFVWTFKEVFTSVGKSANTTQAQHKTDVLRLEAQPKAGYGVTSWTIAGTAKTTPSQLYETTGTAAATYGVAFGDAKPFLVSTNSTQYATLREALTAVGNSGQITVVQNAYVEAGNYTIPSGVTLLVPYESTGKSYTSPSTNYEKIQEFSSATQYVLLTLSSGVNISLSGKLIVMADLCAPVGGGAGSGAPLSAYGRIAMLENSTITVNSGANLYCWGYITGKEGLVTAKSGAKIHEIFQHQNNPGGSAASGWNEDAFFLNQYYVQNIESPLKMEYGAIETVYAQMTVPSSTINNLSASLIGKDDVGMFALTSSGSYLIRTYDPSTDRITYDIYGNVKLNYISMSVYGMDLNTSKYVLPITSNMSVKCHTLNGNASTFNIQYAVSFIPGAELFADEGVTLNIQNKLIIYDRDEWIGKNFAQFNKYSGGYNWTRSSFTPTRTYIRVNADLVDAKVDLNGTMNVSGSLYTTNSGATIISSNGTGVVKLSSAAPGNSNDIQYSANKLGASIKVPMTPAQLHNGDDSYTLTAGAVANDQFIYSKSQEKWLKNPKVVSWNANGGTTDASTMAYSQGSFVGELPAAYKDGHTLEGWYTAADGGTKIDATTKVTANITYYAHWTPKSYTITYRDNGGTAFTGAHVDTPNAHPTTHTFGTATALTGATKEHYTFGGWYRTPSCSGAVVTSLPASTCKNITLYAKWSPEEYTITYKDKGNAAFSGVHGDGYPTKHTYGTATALVDPTRAEYVFDGWYTSSDCSTGKVTSLGATDYSAGITLYAKWTAAVASVTAGSTTYYKTLPEAFTAANGMSSNVTIKLLKTVDVTSATSSTPLKYNAAYTCTLDLNNFTITGTTGTVTGNPRMVQVDNNSAVLIVTDNSTNKGGKISMIRTGARGRYYGVQVSKGTLKVVGGTIYADNQTKWTKADDNGQRFGVDAIRMESGTSLEVTGGTIEAKAFLSARTIDADAGGATITISNGLLKATASATSSNSSSCTQPNEAMEIYTAGGTTTISGGEFISTVSKTASYNIYATDASQKITVSGGKFKVSGGTTTQNVNSAAAASSIDISGGYYSHEANLSKYTSAPYQIWLTTAEDKTEIGNDYNYKVVEAFTVTFNANDHGTAPASQQVAKGKKVTEPTAPTVTGYTFGGWFKEAGCTNAWNFASDVVTEDKTLYAKWTPIPYSITWKVDGQDDVVTNVAYGSIPTFPNSTPTKTETAQYTFEFTGWSDGTTTYANELPSVTGPATYTAQFQNHIRSYTITFVNDNGAPLQSGNVNFGVKPTYSGTPVTPVSTVNSAYEFVGWSPEITDVAGEATYTATYRIANIEVKADESKDVTVSASTNVTTVHVSGSLSVAEGKTLKTTKLFLEASPDGSGQISGKIDAEEAYLDYNLGSSQSGLWYDIAVPWEVDATNGVYLDDVNVTKQLNRDFYLIYYNGALRASENGHTDECWQFVGRESTPDNHMHPGRLYMIYLPKAGVKKLRFKRDGSGPIVKPEIKVYQYDAENVVNAGWNGIANPAIYKAYLNAGAYTVEVGNSTLVPTTYGQKYNPVEDNYDAFNMADHAMNVSQPVFVQVEVSGNNTSRSVVVNPASPSLAPMRKALVHNAAYEVQISAGANYTDRIYLQTVEGKEDSYRIGLDLSKAGTSSKVAQMWVNRYDTKLCVNTTASVGTTANYPLGISVPSDGTYEITSATEMQEGQEMYVTYNGRAIWNLAYGPYAVTLNKGTYNEYGLKLVQKAPTITTGVETVSDEQLESSGVRKVLIDDHIYIIREGAVYTINGKQVK